MTSTATTETSSCQPRELETIAELHLLLARCFKKPDDTTAAAIESGHLGTVIRRKASELGIDVDSQPSLDRPREAYLRTFEAFEGPYAPPAESVYKEWWDGTERGILSGPPAHDMQRRYDERSVDTPDAYPADHVALLLEYASLLLEEGNRDEYRTFHDHHFDWIPEFQERIERTGDEPFYEWAVATLEAVLDWTERTVREEVKPDE